MGKDLSKRETESQKPETSDMKLFTTVNDEFSIKLEGLFLAGPGSLTFAGTVRAYTCFNLG